MVTTLAARLHDAIPLGELIGGRNGVFVSTHPFHTQTGGGGDPARRVETPLISVHGIVRLPTPGHGLELVRVPATGDPELATCSDEALRRWQRVLEHRGPHSELSTQLVREHPAHEEFLNGYRRATDQLQELTSVLKPDAILYVNDTVIIVRCETGEGHCEVWGSAGPDDSVVGNTFSVELPSMLLHEYIRGDTAARQALDGIFRAVSLQPGSALLRGVRTWVSNLQREGRCSSDLVIAT